MSDSPTLCARCDHNVSFHSAGGRLHMQPGAKHSRPAKHAADRYWPPGSQTTKRLMEADEEKARRENAV